MFELILKATLCRWGHWDNAERTQPPATPISNQCVSCKLKLIPVTKTLLNEIPLMAEYVPFWGLNLDTESYQSIQLYTHPEPVILKLLL